jgi:hypothetical protein
MLLFLDQSRINLMYLNWFIVKSVNTFLFKFHLLKSCKESSITEAQQKSQIKTL